MIAISVNLTDTARVAGFVNPGDKVAIFMTGTGQDGSLHPAAAAQRPGHRRRHHDRRRDHHDRRHRRPDDRAAAQDAVHARLSQAEAQKVMFASANGELAFGLLNKDSQVAPVAGHHSRNLFK